MEIDSLIEKANLLIDDIITSDIEIMHLNYLHNKTVLYNTKHIGKDNNI